MQNAIRSTNVRAAFEKAVYNFDGGVNTILPVLKALKARIGQVRDPEWSAKLSYKTAQALNTQGIPTRCTN